MEKPQPLSETAVSSMTLAEIFRGKWDGLQVEVPSNLPDIVIFDSVKLDAAAGYPTEPSRAVRCQRTFRFRESQGPHLYKDLSA